MNRNLVSLLMGLGVAGAAIAQEQGAAAKTTSDDCKLTCPVSNEPVAMDAFTHYRGKRVYFCCSSCKGKFEKDADKYVDPVKKQWEANPPLRTQVSCPVSGGAIDRKVFVSEPMYDVYFANEEAKKQYVADKAKYASQLAGAFTYQTKCIVMGGDVDPAAMKQIDGKKVYFCCIGCETKFSADKEGSFKKLDAQMKANESAYAKLRASHAKPD